MVTPTPEKITQAQLDSLEPAKDGFKWFAIGPNCWGRGTTAKRAFANARMNGGKGNYSLHLVNEGAEVDPVRGTLFYDSKADGIKVNAYAVRANGY